MFRYQVKITSCVVAPWADRFVLMMGATVTSGLLRGQPLSFQIAGVKSKWLTSMRILIAGNANGSLVDCGAWVDYDRQTGKVIALWDLGMTGSISVPERRKVEPEITDEQADEALRLINRSRASWGHRELDPAAAGWSARDLVMEVERLRREGQIKE